MYKLIQTIVVALFAVTPFLGYAQPSPPVTDGLIAYYSFDDCDVIDDTANGSDGVFIGTPNCVCGVSGMALELNGLSDKILFLGPVNNYFDTDNFSISLYFKPFGNPNAQDLLSKREDCTDENAFSVTYTPPLNTVNAVLSEDASKASITTASLSFSTCWHHLVIVRRAGKTSFYLNGALAGEGSAISRVDLDNTAILAIGDSPCLSSSLNRFKGYVDEVAIYGRDLLEPEIEELYLNPDRISNKDTLIYLGASLDLEVANTCVTNFSWTPTDGLDDPFVENPVATPTETTTYEVAFRDSNGCVSTDSVRVTVIDPSTLGCDEIFVPKAFTPNGSGPVVNETIGISNPFALQELVSFEIFDRWGERVFQSDSAFDQWDGTFQGNPLNPGVFIYRVRYKCDGNEKTDAGSFSLMR